MNPEPCTMPCIAELRRIRHLLEMIAPPPEPVRLDDFAIKIRATVAKRFGLTVEQMCSPLRTERIAWPRQVSMALCHQFTKLSLGEVARLHRRSDHTTVSYAKHHVANRWDTEPQVRKLLTELEAELSKTNDRVERREAAAAKQPIKPAT